MLDTDSKEGEVKWVFRWDKEKENTLVLAECGSWEAQLARDVYSKGQVFIFPKEKAPDFLGDETREIPEPKSLISLIEDVSIAMVKALPNCAKVYLASLNESSSTQLHFWLIPRNNSKHQDFLNIEKADVKINDGFTLIAKLRKKFVDRQSSGEWGSMPPYPFGSEVDRKEWCKYAEDYEGKFKTYASQRTSKKNK